MPIPYDDVEYFDHRAAPAGHTARDMALVGRVDALESGGGGGTVDLTAIQSQLDAQAAVDTAQEAVDVANKAVDDAQQLQIDAIDLTGKEDTGVAATLDAALQAQITANADLNTAQQAAITANIAAIAALQASIVIPDDRMFHFLTSDTSFGASDFIRGKQEITASLNSSDITVTWAEGLSDGVVIDAGVHLQDGDKKLILRSGDGLTEKFRNNRGQVSADGAVSIGSESDAVFVKTGLFFDQIRGRCSCMAVPEELSITGSFDESDPLSLSVTVDEATGGSGLYTNYTVTMDFSDSDQNSRQVILSGTRAGSFSETGFSGTLGDIIIDNAMADLYGLINIKIDVIDDANNTATVSL